MLKNKWKGGRTTWSFDSEFPWSNLTGFSGGVAPIPVALDPRVGTEVALFIVDYTEFARDIAQVKPFQLHIKCGLVPCPSGPVLFILFWLPNPRTPHIPFATFECTINPHNPNMMQPYWDLARQTHWHVFVIGPGEEELNWFEFENVFNLYSTLDSVAKIVPEFPCIDFNMARLEFEHHYTLDDLFALEVG